MYLIRKTIDISENFQNFKHCPKGLHAHTAFFTIKINSDEDSIAVLDKINDILTENTVYMREQWTLELMAETLKNELVSSDIDVKQINLVILDVPIEVEIYA